jgi:LysR family transcriptional regulator, low CO2-responsive transcriptional regulator
VDIDQLLAFERVVREGSFSRAAWTLHIAQPTVSARIAALESSVGGPLFHRAGRRITLTERGASFLPYARRALTLLGEGMEAARLATDGQRGRVTLGALGSLAGAFLAPALAAFQATHPAVEMLVRAADHEQIVELLIDGVVELGLIAWPCVVPPLAELSPLLHLREPVMLAVHPSHQLAGLGAATQDEIVRLARPFIRLRWWQTDNARVARLAARAEQLVDLPMETARWLVTSGVGAGFFTRALIADELASGALREVPVADMPPIVRDSALVRLARAAPLSAASADLVGAIRERARVLGLLAG